jgi:stage V sporulation protein B
MYGAAILSGAGIVIKIIGACFRIPLANLIGGEGMGYYNAVYPVYTLLVVIATTGIPIAVSRLVAEHVTDGDPGGAHRVFRIALVLMGAIGVCFFAALFFFAGPITNRMTELSGAVYAMRAIAPALIFVPIMAAFRGYFQGMQDMKPTALSQIAEQIFRVVFGLLLAFFLYDMGVEYAAAGGTFGATAGAAAGLVCMAVIYSKFKNSASFRARRAEARATRDAARQMRTGQIIRKIIWIAVPITVGAAVMPIMYNIDMWVVPARLSYAGFDPVAVRSMYGQLTGFAEPLTNLPKVLTQAIAVSMVPAIVRAWKQRDKESLEQNVTLGFRLALIIGLPCAVGFMILPEPILLLLYPDKPIDAVGAAPALFIFAIGVVFLSSIDALTSVLQGIGKQMIPFVNIAIGAACKFLITYLLTGIPVFNIRGAAIGTVCAYVIATVLNYRAVVVYTGIRFNLSLTFLRPVISAGVMGAVAAVCYHGLEIPLGGKLSAVCSILVAIAAYVILLFATHSIRGEELKLLPKGDKIYKIYSKISKKFAK